MISLFESGDGHTEDLHSEVFPTDQVVHFKNEYFESKIFETRLGEENVFSFLKPEGIIAMRLANKQS